MRARTLLTFGAATAILVLTACFEDEPAAPQSAQGTQTGDAGTQSPDRDAATPGDARDAGAADAGADASVVDELDASDDASSDDASSDDASSDAGSDASSDAAPDADVCGSGAASVDQSQLGANGNLVISATQSPSQTFTVGSTGVLTGIELGLASCNGVDPSSSIVLTLSRGATVLAMASLPASSISTTNCGSFSLSPTDIGAGYYDLSSSCIAVTAGDELTAALTISGPSATCSSSTYQCVGGGNDGHFCMEAEDCEYAARLGMQGDVYSGGAIVLNGNSYGWDAVFKTFVR